MILLIYNDKICRDILLPNVYDTDHTITLKGGYYQLRADLRLELENSGGTWTMRAAHGYAMRANGRQGDRFELTDQLVIELITRHGERIQVIASKEPMSFHVMDKYDLNELDKVTIGSGSNEMVRYELSGFISSRHAVIYRYSGGWAIEDMSRNGTFVGHQRVKKNQALMPGDHVTIFGLHLVFMPPYLLIGANCGKLKTDRKRMQGLRFSPVESAVMKKEHPESYFSRSPRDLPSLYRNKIEIEAPPAPNQQKEKPKYLVIGPAFTMAIPMMLGFAVMWIASRKGSGYGAFMYMGLITAVGAAIIGTVWAILNLNYEKRERIAQEEQRFNAYSAYLVNIAEQLRAMYRHNTSAMLERYPAAAECVRYDRTSPKLWNRNMTHDDFLYQRIGLGDMPFQVEIEIPKERFTLINDTLLNRPAEIRNEYAMMRGVPVGLSLADHPLVGLVGRGYDGAIQMMHTLTAGIAAAHAYTDVKLVYLYDERDERHLADWECMRFLPHVWSEDRQIRFMAANEVERRDVLFHLSNVLRVRMEEDTPGKAFVRPRPHYVIFVADPSLLEGELLAKYIYDANPRYGISTLLLSETVERLPNVCEMVIENDAYFRGYYSLLNDESENYKAVIPDQISRAELEMFGKNLANIEIKEMEISSEIPASISFLEMYGARRVEDLDIEERWRKNRTYHSLRALIGKKSGNQDCYLDIHEKFHGPHGLVAGTTGSGKSETLQTYILSLAVNYSPDDVSFFIIDFKGGGMANLFSDLPHLSGFISNLSGNQVNRAMISIKSENTRRQKLLAENGVNHINAYTQAYKEHRVAQPMPHLFIIIDEFAELKREEPDFMQELISVAQVGRSLGVHLILATQKPGGTVDDNIFSNSKFRLCLRVQDRQDSIDMLHRPDAAYLTQAGRCYLQVGNDEIFELFQSGYSGAIYNAGSDAAGYASMINRTGKTDLIGVSDRRQRTETSEEETELDAVIGLLNRITKIGGYMESSKLWLETLGERILLSSLREPPEITERFSLTVPVGVYDDPAHQHQGTYAVDFAEGGHLVVCGGAISGKSTLLQTIIYGLTHRFDPDQVQLYILDYSSHSLTSFEEAPHVGGIVTENQEERAEKFFTMLSKIMDQRKALLKGGHFSQYVRLSDEPVPAIFVVLDNYVSFREQTHDRFESDITRLVREGVGYGIYLIVSATGFGISEIPLRIADQIRTVITLEQPDKYKYMDVLRTTALPIEPETNVRGRGLAYVGDQILEFQTALCADAPDDFARGQMIEEESKQMKAAWQGILPARIPEIPDDPTWSLLRVEPEYQAALHDPRLLPIGYREEDASVYSVDLGENYCMAITGKPRSGKSNILQVILLSAMEKGAEIYAFEKKEGSFSPFEQFAEQHGIHYAGSCEQLYKTLKDLMPEFVRRNKIKQELLQSGKPESTVLARMLEERPIIIGIDDFGDFLKMVYTPDAGIGAMDGFLENIQEKGRLHHIYFFACIKNEDTTALMGYQAYHLFTSAHRGIHAGGNLGSQKLFRFQNISLAAQNKTAKKGYVTLTADDDETVGIDVVIPYAGEGEEQPL